MQKEITLDDFLDIGNRRLAEVYWEYQRNEGEPACSAFLTVLGPLGLAQFAIELVQELESAPGSDRGETLQQSVHNLKRERELRAHRLLRAKARNVEEGEKGEDLLRQAIEKARKRSGDDELMTRGVS